MHGMSNIELAWSQIHRNAPILEYRNFTCHASYFSMKTEFSIFTLKT